MASFNKVILIGNVTADPQVRETGKGTKVTDVSLAINRYYTGENGMRQEETTFVDVTLWGRQAEIAGEYLKKGRPVMIEGRLQLDTWEDRETKQKRSRLRIVGENMQLLGSPRDGQGGDSPAPRQQNAGSPPSRNSSPPPPMDDFDDDIPF